MKIELQLQNEGNENTVFLESNEKLLITDLQAIEKRLNYIDTENNALYTIETILKDSELLLQYILERLDMNGIIDLIFDAVDSYDIADLTNTLSNNNYLDFSVYDFIVIENVGETYNRYIILKAEE